MYCGAFRYTTFVRRALVVARECAIAAPSRPAAMRIKSITIEGYKNYKDRIVLEGLSPSHNVVVGANGSGKSNFFSGAPARPPPAARLRAPAAPHTWRAPP